MILNHVPKSQLPFFKSSLGANAPTGFSVRRLLTRSPPCRYEYYRVKKFKNIVCSSWKQKQRELNYTIPKTGGLNPQVVVQERQTIRLDTHDTVCVEIISRTPGVPYVTVLYRQVLVYISVWFALAGVHRRQDVGCQATHRRCSPRGRHACVGTARRLQQWCSTTSDPTGVGRRTFTSRPRSSGSSHVSSSQPSPRRLKQTYTKVLCTSRWVKY
jgi:hypothetical protein